MDYEVRKSEPMCAILSDDEATRKREQSWESGIYRFFDDVFASPASVDFAASATAVLIASGSSGIASPL